MGAYISDCLDARNTMMTKGLPSVDYIHEKVFTVTFSPKNRFVFVNIYDIGSRNY